MVAIVTSGGLGLDRSSANVLGGQGLLGQSSLGRAGDNVYVNAASGNLVISSTDEMLFGTGEDAALSSTYNSQGLLNDDNGDNWRSSVSRTVTGLTGTYGTAGSTVTRTDWDGSRVVFNWDASHNAYIAKESSGAYDTLTLSGSTWTWTDGSTQATETYDSANAGRILTSLDHSGQGLTFTYNGSGLVSRVTTQTGEYTNFVYSGSNLTELDTFSYANTGAATSSGSLLQSTRVRYGYDSSNRLTTVTVDLTPNDHSITDGKTYVTTYGYDAHGNVNSITQTDGSSLQIGYTQIGGVYRVSSLTEAVATGVTRVTNFSYDTTNRVTTVTDPTCQTTKLTYDAKGGLIQIDQAPAVSGGADQVTAFTYDANGNVLTTTAPGGQTTTYQYDANGNCIFQQDSLGDTVTRTYSATNQQLTETHYTVPNPDLGAPFDPTQAVIAGTGDLNGDGYTDVVMRNNTTGQWGYFAGGAAGYTWVSLGVFDTAYTIVGIGDVDGDGVADVVWQNQTSGEWGYSAMGASGAPVWHDVGVLSEPIVGVGDVDGDGKLDVVWQDSSTRDYGYATMNAGGSGFTSHTIGTSSDLVIGVADVNGDGRADINFRNDARTAWTAIGMDSSGVFAQVAEDVTGTTYDVVGFFDMTNAGKADVVQRENSSGDWGYLRVDDDGSVDWINLSNTDRPGDSLVGVGYTSGDGVPQPIYLQDLPTGLQYGATQPPNSSTFDPAQAVIAGMGDLNGDGFTDVVMRNNTTGQWGYFAGSPSGYSWVSMGVFDTAYTIVGIGDIDGDGAADVVWQNQSTGEWGYTALSPSGSPVWHDLGAISEPIVAVGDIDGDGKADVVWRDPSTGDYGYATVNPGASGFTSHAIGTSSDPVKAVADLNGDGRADIIFLSDAADHWTAVGMGSSGTFASLAEGWPGPGYSPIGFEDLDNNGKADWIWRDDSTGGLGVLRVADDGSVSWNGLGTVRPGDTAIGIGDINGDGAADLIYLQDLPTGLQYGAAQPSASSTFDPSHAVIAGMGDLNGDGFTDVVIRNNRTGQWGYIAGGASGYTWVSMGVFDTAYTIVGIGDIDGDGVADVVWQNHSTGDWGYTAMGPSGPTWHDLGVLNEPIVAVGDIDGDGKADVVWQDSSTRDYGYATVNFGSSGFTSHAIGSSSDRVKTVGDVNGDGRVDIIFFDDDGANWTAIGMDSSGAFAQVAGSWVDTDYALVGVTDMNGDGTADLVWRNHSTGIWVYNSENPDGSQGSVYGGDDLPGVAAIGVGFPNGDGVPQPIYLQDLPTGISYGAAGPSGSVAGPTPGAETAYSVYDTSGHLHYQISAQGDVTQYNYTGDLLTSTIQVSTAYDLSGLSATSPPSVSTVDAWFSGLNLTGGERTDYAYDFRGNLASATTYGALTSTGAGVTTSNVSKVTYVYDQGGRLLSQLSSGNAVSGTAQTYAYDGLGRVVASTDPDNNTTSTVFNDASGSTVVTFADTTTQTNVYNLAGELISSTHSASPSPVTTTYKYDAQGNLRIVADPLGDKTYFLYDKTGRKVAQVVPDGALTEYVYDANNDVIATIAYATKLTPTQLASLVDASGNPTSVTLAQVRPAAASGDARSYSIYDAAGRVIETIDPAGAVVQYAYDGASELVATTAYANSLSSTVLSGFVTAPPTSLTLPAADASADRTSRYFYDADSRQVAVLDPDGYLTQTTYDSAGRKTQTVRYFNVASSSLWASGTLAQLLTSVGTNAGDIGQTYAYDDRGLLTTYTDGAGRTTTYTYDFAGRVATETDGANDVTQYAYDAAGNLSQKTDPRGVVTTYTYDAENRLKTEREDSTGLNLLTSIGYDALGDVTSVTDPSGMVTTTTYDADGRKTSVIVDSGTGRQNLTTTYGYDADSRVTSMTEGAGTVAARTTTYGYDSLGRLLTTVVDAGTGHLNLTTTRTYDADGNLAAVTDPTGAITRYVYNAFGQQVYAITPAGPAVGSGEYGVITQTTYDADGRSIQTTQYLSLLTPSVLTGLGLTPTVSTVALLVVASPASDRTTTYAYDSAGQVTSVTVDPGSGHLNLTTTYAYDDAGNLLSTTDPLSNVTRTVYDAAGRKAFTIDATGAVCAYTYDADGDVVKQVEYAAAYTASGVPTLSAMQSWATANASAANDRVTRALYDNEDRLAFAIDPAGDVTAYAHDGAGRVTQTTHYATPYTGGDTTLSAMQTWVSSHGLSGTTTTTGDEVTRATYDTAGRVTDTYDATSVRTHYVYDGLGNVTDVTVAYGTSSAQTTHNTYDTAGRLASTTVDYGTGHLNLLTSYQYDADGRVTQVTDPNSHVTTNTYNSEGLLIHQTDGAGDTATISYNAFYQKQTATDPNGNTTYFYYDNAGRPTLQVDPLGYATQTTYDADGNATQVTRYYNATTGASTSAPPTITPNVTTGANAANSLDQVTNSTFDGMGRVTSTTDAEGNRTLFVRNAFGQPVYVIDPLGDVSKTTYDADGRVIQVTRYATALTAGALSSLGTNPAPSAVAADVTSSVANDITTTYTYDAFGNRTQMVEAAGRPEQRTTTYAYDLDNRLLSTSNLVFLSGSTTGTATESTQYDAFGNVVLTTDAKGNQTHAYYDGANRRIAQVDASGALTKWTYDAAGNVTLKAAYATLVTPTAAGGAPPATPSDSPRATYYVYDGANRLTQTVLASVQYAYLSGSTLVYGLTNIVNTIYYDADGHVRETVDGNGNLSYLYYDADGRKTAQIDAGGYLTRYQLDAEGNVLKEIQYATAASGYGWSGYTAPSSSGADRITDYTYDRNSRELTQTREAVQASTVSSTGALTTVSAPSTITYTYDGNGNVLTKTQAALAGTTGDYTHYGYDAFGRLVHSDQTPHTDYGSGAGGAAVLVTPSTDITYNGLGLVTSTTVHGDGTSTAPDRVTTTVYGAGGRVISVTDPTGFTQTSSYDLNGNLVARQYGRKLSNGTIETDSVFITYDSLNHETSRKNGKLSGSTWVYGDSTDQYYDAFGEVVAEGTNTGGVQANAQEYAQYDNAGRVWLTNMNGGVSRAYAYDKNGNSTVLFQSVGVTNLKTAVSLPALFADTSGDITETITVYDARNEVTNTIQPSSSQSYTPILATEIDTTNQSSQWVGGAYAVGQATSYAGTGGVVTVTSWLDVEEGQYPPFGETLYTAASYLTIDATSASLAGATIGWITTSAGAIATFTPGAVTTIMTGYDSQPTSDPNQAISNASRFEGPFSVVIGTAWGSVTVGSASTYDANGVARAYVAHTLELEGVSSTAANVLCFVRPYGSTGPYSEVGANKNATGYWNINVDGAPFNGQANGSWEVRYMAFDTSGAILQSADGHFITDGNGTPSYAPANDPVYGGGQSMLVNWQGATYLIVTGLPPGTSSGVVSYGPTYSSTATLLNGGFVPQNGVYYLNVTGWTSQQFCIQPVNSSGATDPGYYLFGTFTAGGQSTAQLVAGSPVSFRPQQAGVSSIKVYYRLQGSTGGFIETTLSNPIGGAFLFSAAGLRPASGQLNYEYYYDAYDAAGNLIPPVNGSDHVHGSLQLQADAYAATDDYSIQWAAGSVQNSQFQVDRQQAWDAFGEVVSETDGRGDVTTLAYDTLGKLVTKTSPQVTWYDESGAVQPPSSPVEHYFYDISGRQVGQEDANGNLTTEALLADSGYDGQQALTTITFNADGTQTKTGYDIFSEARTITTAFGTALAATTTNFYDGDGNLIEVDHPLRSGGNSSGVQLKDHYGYDGLGERITHTDSVNGSAVETTDYDVQGRVTQTTDFAGLTTTYARTWYAGNVLSTPGLGNFGGWQTVTTNSAGLVSYENDDLFGNVSFTQDFGGHQSWTTYNLAGEVAQQTSSAGENITYTYYANGYVASIVDNVLKMKSTYDYDNDGNRTAETDNSTAASPIYYENEVITYDAMNRVTEIKDPAADIVYTYDLAGNRREVKSTYTDGVGNTLASSDYWYAYDSMNRFVVTMGTRSGGHIVAGATGTAITYDVAGNRHSATYQDPNNSSATDTETYTYTADGYLENTLFNGTLSSQRTNDALGRVTTSVDPNGTTTYAYDGDNRVTHQTNTDTLGVATTVTNDYKAWNGSAYAGADQGVLVHSASVKGGVTTNTNDYYVWWGAAQLNESVNNVTNPATSAGGTVEIVDAYDVNGRLAQTVNNAGGYTYSYTDDALGEVLVRQQIIGGLMGQEERNYWFNGHRVGDINTLPSLNQAQINYATNYADYAEQLSQTDSSSLGKGAFRTPLTMSDSDQNYNASAPGLAAQSYTVTSSDVSGSGPVLQRLAAAFWGDANLWYLIADANGITLQTPLVAGQTLVIPNKVANFHNNSSTFRNYDPSQDISDFVPTQGPEVLALPSQQQFDYATLGLAAVGSGSSSSDLMYRIIDGIVSGTGSAGNDVEPEMGGILGSASAADDGGFGSGGGMPVATSSAGAPIAHDYDSSISYATANASDAGTGQMIDYQDLSQDQQVAFVPTGESANASSQLINGWMYGESLGTEGIEAVEGMTAVDAGGYDSASHGNYDLAAGDAFNSVMNLLGAEGTASYSGGQYMGWDGSNDTGSYGFSNGGFGSAGGTGSQEDYGTIGASDGADGSTTVAQQDPLVQTLNIPGSAPASPPSDFTTDVPAFTYTDNNGNEVSGGGIVLGQNPNLVDGGLTTSLPSFSYVGNDGTAAYVGSPGPAIRVPGFGNTISPSSDNGQGNGGTGNGGGLSNDQILNTIFGVDGGTVAQSDGEANSPSAPVHLEGGTVQKTNFVKDIPDTLEKLAAVRDAVGHVVDSIKAANNDDVPYNVLQETGASSQIDDGIHQFPKGFSPDNSFYGRTILSDGRNAIVYTNNEGWQGFDEDNNNAPLTPFNKGPAYLLWNNTDGVYLQNDIVYSSRSNAMAPARFGADVVSYLTGAGLAGWTGFAKSVLGIGLSEAQSYSTSSDYLQMKQAAYETRYNQLVNYRD